MKRTLIAALIASSTLLAPLTAGAIGVYPDFTVSTSNIPGRTATALANGDIDANFTADKMTGAYKEIVSLKSDGTFASKTVATFTAFTYGSDPLSGTSMNSTYVLYAVLDATGTFSGAGFTGTTATFSLYLDSGYSDRGIDAGKKTAFTFGADAYSAVTFNNNLDDYLLGSAPALAQAGNVDLVLPAAFDFRFKDFALTSIDGIAGGNVQSGKSFFVAPEDFYVNVHSDGDINEAAVATLNSAIAEALTTGQATRQLNGELSADFSRAVPEPTGLALVGLALAALGLVSRRRKSV